MTLLTADRVFQKYKVPGIECQVSHPAEVAVQAVRAPTKKCAQPSDKQGKKLLQRGIHTPAQAALRGLKNFRGDSTIAVGRLLI